MKRHINILLTLAAMIAAVCLPSCSADDPTPGTGPDLPAPGSFTISARNLASSASTRASLDPSYGEPDELRDEELIHSFYVIFVKKANQDSAEGIVMEVVEAKTGVSGEGYEEQSFIPKNLTGEGLYDIFAFANIGYDTIINKIDKNLFMVGESVKVKDLRAKIGNYGAYTPSFEVYEANTAKETDYMPMSGIRRNVTITDNLETGNNPDKNSIEVIRMFAKVELMIKNSTGLNITVQSIKFSMVNNCEFKLFPNYKILGNGMDNINEFEKYLGGDYTDQGIVLGKPDNDTENWKDLKAGSVEKAIFYTQDSSARLTNPGFNHFMISLKIVRENGGIAEVRYAPTDELQWIQRNDHIVIPISLSDVSVDWQVMFYPPIGGYPAIVETDEDFNYRCIFGTQGEFSIRPIIRGANGQPIEGATFRIVDNETDKNEQTVLTPSSDASPSIFAKKPKRQGNEFVGVLNTNQGTAIFPLCIEIKYNADGKEKTEYRFRNIYIIRKNP